MNRVQYTRVSPKENRSAMWVGDHVFAYFLRLPWSVWICMVIMKAPHTQPNPPLHHNKPWPANLWTPEQQWNRPAHRQVAGLHSFVKKIYKVFLQKAKAQTSTTMTTGWACNCKTFIDIPQDFHCMKTEHSSLREHEENTVCCLYV